MTPEDISAYLKAVVRRPSVPTLEAVRKRLAQLKRGAVEADDQAAAKNVWCLEQALTVQEHYLSAFRHLKATEFYEAWCELERIEVALAALERHDNGFWPTFHLDTIQAHTVRWQGLFPYRLFFSPELLQLEKVCSICHQRVLPRSFCGHRVGEIYSGEMCHRIITKLGGGLGIGIVDKPVQKYSVLFLGDKTGEGRRDQYNYELVQYAIALLREPFDAWEVERSNRRQPHARYSDVGRNGPCPCESGKKYKKCCLPEAGVLRPHYEFTFAVQPPEGVLLQEVFIK